MKPENANKYTDEENAQIKNLQQRFLNEILPRVVTPPALEVPELGEHRLSLANEPGIKAELVTQSTLTMHQSQSKHVRSAEVRPGGVTDINSRLVFERKAIGIHVDVPANHKMIVVSDQGERAVGPGPVALPANPGQYILELYDARGTKLGDKSFTVPDVRASHDLSEAHFGKSLRTAAGALEPELVKSRETRRRTGSAGRSGSRRVSRRR